MLFRRMKIFQPLAVILLLLGGCAAVFPEMQTAVHAPGPGPLEPPPSDDIFYIYFESANLPNRTRDGRPWNPDPFAKLIINDQDHLRTPVERDQRKPTWPGQKLANYRIGPTDRVVIELWDQETLQDTPVCAYRITDIREYMDERSDDIKCESGARIRLHVEPARAMVGVGLYYELRGSDGVRVTRVVGQSPASRAGIGVGDRIMAIQGESVMAMDALGIKSKINTHARTGLELDVWFSGGERKKVTLLEGPMYPLFDDDLSLPQTRSGP
jgi:PDZ domain